MADTQDDDDRRAGLGGEGRAEGSDTAENDDTSAEGSTRRYDTSGDGDATPPSGLPVSSTGETPAQDTPTDEAPQPRGRIREQDPSTTTPREPTLAEQRARREHERRERAQHDATVAAEERKRKNRKRVLIGGGVAVGVVALVAIAYAASQPDEVTGQCVDQNNVVQPDEVCQTARPSGGYYSGGTFVPIFLGGFGGGSQYHYNYGSQSPVGSVARGGSVAAPPSGTSVRGSSGSSVGTSSGGTVSRGGLGVGGSSSGTSGSSSGSGGSSSGS